MGRNTKLKSEMKPLQKEVHKLRSKIISIDYFWQSMSLTLAGIDSAKIIKQIQELLAVLEQTCIQAQKLLAVISEAINTDKKIAAKTRCNLEKIKFFLKECLKNITQEKLQYKIKSNHADCELKAKAILVFLTKLNRKQARASKELEIVREILIEQGKYYLSGERSNEPN